MRLRTANWILILLLFATGSLPAVEVRLSAPLDPGNVVVRTATDGGRLYVFREESGKKPEAQFDLQVTGKHREHFAGGLSITPGGDLFFCGGQNNLSVFELPAGETTARSITSFPVVNAEYSYLCALLAVDRDTLLTLDQSGVVSRLVRDGSKFKTVVSRQVVVSGLNGGSFSFDPKTETGFLVFNGAHPTQNVIAFDIRTLQTVSSLGDDLELTGRPFQIVWIPAIPPLLAISNNHALPIDGKDSKTRHIIGLHFQSSLREIQPAMRSNLADGKSFSLVANSTDNAWISSLDAMACDVAGNRILISSRTRRNNMNIYSISMDVMAQGGLTLDKPVPILGVPDAIVRNLVVVTRQPGR